MNIELRPHIAKREQTPMGELTTEFDQHMLYVDGQHYGYVPKRDGAHIALIRNVHPDLAEAIKVQVEEMTGSPRSRVSQPSGLVPKSSKLTLLNKKNK